ncbi:MAG: YicC family protein, partial [Chthoniobacterales bacterium]
MKSMTGFGRGECVAKGLRYSVEISTVNRRNAEIVINLPRELSVLENSVREVVAPVVTRGRATVTIAVSGGNARRSVLDPDLFRKLHAELVRQQRALKIPGAPTVSDVIQLYAATARDSASAAAPDAPAVLKATKSALRSLETMRAKEGAHLAKELQRLLDVFCRQISGIAKLAPSVTTKHREAMRARLAALEPSFATDDERLARELALFADRSDITEELSRLDRHVAQFRAGLSSKEANGRALDFLAQELFR